MDRKEKGKGRRRQPGQAIGCYQWAAAIGSGHEREGQRQTAEEGSLGKWSRQVLVGSSNRKLTGIRRLKAEKGSLGRQ